ncbi:MAG: hypothetical protein M0C28_40295 [Candidatus Moduliflexus flocculans]|nr:hypothetical protein [Candidatus Moduliflexus flocculans]
MTERRRVLTLLSGGTPDRVPWFGDLDYWATSLIGRGERPADFKASDAYIDWHRDLRCGYYLQGTFLSGRSSRAAASPSGGKAARGAGASRRLEAR